MTPTVTQARSAASSSQGDADNAGSLVVDAGSYFLTAQDTGDLTQSAAKWRSIINRVEQLIDYAGARMSVS